MVYWYIPPQIFISAYSDNPVKYNLLQNLLSDYSLDVHPVHDPSQILEVSIGITMRQIIDVVSLGAMYLVWIKVFQRYLIDYPLLLF